MKIGYLLDVTYSLSSGGNGVRVSAVRQIEALRRAGHEVVCIEPWNCDSEIIRSLDFVNYFVGGFSMFDLEKYTPDPARHLVLTATIDSNQPNWRYRLAATMGNTLPKIFTIPGMIQRQARKSSLILARSTHERGRMIHGLGLDPQKVEVVLLGADPPGPADPDEVRRRFKLPEQFLLHVSLYTQERKNVVRLIEAVGPTGLPLVIAGTPAPGAVLDRIQELARKYPVTVLGYQDRQTLNSLYAACRVFCLPTTHEGVGLVALEAASYGAGVVITKNGGPRDYLQDLAYYVDPMDVPGIRQAVLAAWAEPRSAALKQRVAALSWDASAKSLIAAVEKHGLQSRT